MRIACWSTASRSRLPMRLAVSSIHRLVKPGFDCVRFAVTSMRKTRPLWIPPNYPYSLLFLNGSRLLAPCFRPR